jgi:hypothetical protein
MAHGAYPWQMARSTTTRMLSPEIPVEYSTGAAASSSVGNCAVLPVQGKY